MVSLFRSYTSVNNVLAQDCAVTHEKKVHKANYFGYTYPVECLAEYMYSKFG